MKNLSKKTYIYIGILSLIVLLTIVGYKSYSTSKNISEFSNYFNEYKQGITTYIVNDNQEKYENLIKESEKVISDKDYKKIEELKLKLNQFEEKLLEINYELANKNIKELESLDISKLNDKNSILSKIEDVKKLINENKFIKANEGFIELKNDINTKLEVIKEEENKKVEEAAKKNEEEKRKVEENNKFTELKAMEYYLSNTSSGSYLKNRKKVKLPDNSRYFESYIFIPDSSDTDTADYTIYFHIEEKNNYDRVGSVNEMKINPAYNGIKYFKISLELSFKSIGGDHIVTDSVDRGVIYENGVYEPGGFNGANLSN